MKSTILTQIVENLATVSRFFPERDKLIPAIVGETMRSLRKVVLDSKSSLMSAFESPSQLHTLQLMVDDPQTEALLQEFGEKVVDFLEHVRRLETSAATSKSDLAN